MGTIITSVSTLLRTYNMKNVKVPIITNNPYEDRIPKTTNVDKELYKSSLGTPVVADVTIKGNTYTDNNGRSITFKDIVLVTVLVSVSQSKNIILTDIQGADGTTKEYIGMGDYSISINGILTGGNGHYPTDEVAALKEVCKAPIPLVVVSRYLQNLDIYNIVIKDYDFEQTAGGYSQQNFSLNCLSDVPVEILIQQ